jgi:hypothetical protein
LVFWDNISLQAPKLKSVCFYYWSIKEHFLCVNFWPISVAACQV